MADSVFSLMTAIVISRKDEEGRPCNKGRVQVRIPAFHGPLKSEDIPDGRQGFIKATWIRDELLPWASVVYPIGTKDVTESTAETMFQDKEVVFVSFSGGDPSYPIIVGTTGMILEEGGQ